MSEIRDSNQGDPQRFEIQESSFRVTEIRANSTRASLPHNKKKLTIPPQKSQINGADGSDWYCVLGLCAYACVCVRECALVLARQTAGTARPAAVSAVCAVREPPGPRGR